MLRRSHQACKVLVANLLLRPSPKGGQVCVSGVCPSYCHEELTIDDASDGLCRQRFLVELTSVLKPSLSHDCAEDSVK